MPSPVRLSIIIPTIMRPSLVATLASIREGGICQEDEVIVVVDAAHAEDDAPGGYEEVERLARRVPVLIVRNPANVGAWGCHARNNGIGMAKGTHLVFIDDDDVYEAGALDRIRGFIQEAPDDMHVWRMLPRGKSQPLWATSRMMQGNVGTPMFAVPRHAAGAWTVRYEGDFDFARASLANLDGRAKWHEEVLVRCG